MKQIIDTKKNFNYTNMFLLFIVGSVLGTVIEGFYTMFAYGKWESHVIALYGPFCIIYGLGMVSFYIIGHFLRNKSLLKKIIFGFLISAIACTIIELASGLILEYGMGMRAWSYLNEPLNFRGHICLKASLIWGVLGLVFIVLIKPLLDIVFRVTNLKIFKIICFFLSILMTLDLALTAVAMVRWSDRHKEIPPSNKFEEVIDKLYDDDFMHEKFMEWRYLEDEEEYQQNLHNN